MKEQIDKAVEYAYSINEKSYFRKPYLHRWRDCRVVKIKDWNFAVKVVDKVIHVVDACHEKNMSNNIGYDNYEDNDLEQASINPRITNIRFIKCNNDCLGIKCNIDGEEQLMERMTKEDSDQYITVGKQHL